MKKMTIEDKLHLCKRNLYDVSHIILDEHICNERCKTKICVKVCPAKSYEQNEAGAIVFNHDNCLECGSCRIVCPENNVEWGYPVFGKGIVYKHG